MAAARPLRTLGAGTDGLTADEVFVPPGAGALVREQLSGTYLITDRGVRYPTRGAEAVRALGYGTVPPTPVDATVLALFPTGPALDPAAAQRAVGALGRTDG